mgnify:CR=1 FL=1
MPRYGLKTTGQIPLVPPFFEHFGKRLIESPKICFLDFGLSGYLLGIESEALPNRSPFSGPRFETMAASEIVKA